MSKEILLSYISKIQQEFPDELLEKVFLEKVTVNNFDELLARSLVTFPPIYLPIFERDGDLYGIHLGVDNNWENRAWLKLPHDCEYPFYLVSHFKYMPYACMDGVFNIKRYYGEISDNLNTMLLRNQLSLPDRNYYEKNKNDYFSIITDYDLSNYILKINKATSILFEEDAFPFVSELYKQVPDDKYVAASKIILDYLLRKPIDYNEALLLLQEEFSYSFYSMLWLGGISTGPELLNEIKNSISDKIDKTNPFYVIKDEDYTNSKIIEKLVEIADILNKKNEYVNALNQLRNAATVAGSHGTGVTKDLCIQLAKQSKIIAQDSLAGHLALYASTIIDRGA